MATYKPTKNTVATYGESSPAVLALQQSLNAKGANLAPDSKYGPLTAQAVAKYGGSATPAPTPAPTAIPTEKFARGTNAYDTKITDIESKLSGMVTPPKSQNDIFNEKRGQAQSVIDAVNAQFNRVIQEQNVTNQGFNDRVRASNVSSGLAGSDFGTAAAVGQEQKNKKAVDLIEAERNAKINEILTGIASRADEEYQRQRQEYVKGLGDDLNRVRDAKEQDKKQALESIQSLARQKVSLDKYKSADPKGFETLMNEYGGSELDLESQWNESLPDDQKVQYQDKIIQGPNGMATLFRYGLNPQTGTVEQKEYPLDVNYNTLQGIKPTVVDGRVFALETDANGNEIARPLTSKTSSASTPKGSVTTGKATFSPDQISGFSSRLEAQRGADGWVDPTTYLEAYQAWTDPEVGGLAKDFLAKYPPNKYANPANTTLPALLRNTTGAKATTTTNKRSV